MQRPRRTFLVVVGLVSVWAALGDPPTAGARGWVGKMPPNRTKIDSGRRNHVFYVGDPVKFKLDGVKLDRFEVRDYWGQMIDKGPATEQITVNATLPGWYKLYVYAQKPAPKKPKGELDSLLDDSKTPKPESTVKEAEPPPKTGPEPEELWGDAAGGTMFVIFRRDPHFPDMPGVEVGGGSNGVLDQVTRGVTGMGPQRYQLQCSNPDETIKGLDIDVAIDKQYYLGRDPQRKRALIRGLRQRYGRSGGCAQDRRALQVGRRVLGTAQRTELRVERRRFRDQGTQAVLRDRSRRRSATEGARSGRGGHWAAIAALDRRFPEGRRRQVSGRVLLPLLQRPQRRPDAGPQIDGFAHGPAREVWRRRTGKMADRTGLFCLHLRLVSAAIAGTLDDAGNDALRAIRAAQGAQSSVVRPQSRFLGFSDLVGERRQQLQSGGAADARLVGGVVRHSVRSAARFWPRGQQALPWQPVCRPRQARRGLHRAPAARTERCRSK